MDKELDATAPMTGPIADAPDELTVILRANGDMETVRPKAWSAQRYIESMCILSDRLNRRIKQLADTAVDAGGPTGSAGGA